MLDEERELAKQSKKRDLEQELVRLEGEIEASAKGAAAMARVNDDARRVRDARLAELRALGRAETPLHRYGRYSELDRALDAEREYVKDRGYAWLETNPRATRGEMTAFLEDAAALYATARTGRHWVLLRYESVLAEWIANAAAARKCEATWESFRDYVLALGREAALGIR